MSQPQIHVTGVHRVMPDLPTLLFVPGRGYEEVSARLVCACGQCPPLLEPLRSGVRAFPGRAFTRTAEEAARAATEFAKLASAFDESRARDTVGCCRAGAAVAPKPCPVHGY